MPLLQTSGNATADAFGGGVAAVFNYIEDVFSTYLYTGTGAAQTITNGIDLAGEGGLVWIKDRMNVDFHILTDTVKGLRYELTTGQAYSYTTMGSPIPVGSDVTAFNNNGFSLGTNYNATNYLGGSFASWTFRKQPKFFDIVTWTGTGTNRTIAHNIGGAVGCMLVKRTDQAGNWQVYHNSLTSAAYSIQLNLTAAQASAPTIWNSTAPTSSVFSVGTDATVNASGGTYVAYLFAHNAGGFGLTGTDNVISCGSFTTDGSGVYSVTLGYEPQLVMIKTVYSGGWQIFDNMRGMPVANGGAPLFPNLSSAEGTAQYNRVNPTATGFFGTNSFGLTAYDDYIYIAIRHGPMKVPTDGTKVFNAIARTSTGALATVTGAGFTPDLLISGKRNVSAYRSFQDRLRGPNIVLPIETIAQLNGTDAMRSFDMDGATFGADNGGYYPDNNGSTPYINWFFQRAPSFFDEVCYTGTGVVRTVAHNLAAVPELMIVKSRGTAGYWWNVYAASLGNDRQVVLNDSTPVSVSVRWNETSPTVSNFTVGTSPNVNGSGDTYVAYLFATCAGVSKVGSYTGNGTTQAIACGFAGGARFVLIKRTDAAGDWYTYDTARGMTVLTDPYLLLNSTAAEQATLGSVTSTTGGFTVNAAILAAINTNAASYIYLSIA